MAQDRCHRGREPEHGAASEHERAAGAAAGTVVADAPIDIPERPSDLDAEAVYMAVIAAHLRAMDELATGLTECAKD